MGTLSITQAVKDELHAHRSEAYVCAVSGVLLIKEGQEPDEEGYYTQNIQANLRPEVPNKTVFIKKTDPITFWDFVLNEEITI